MGVRSVLLGVMWAGTLTGLASSRGIFGSDTVNYLNFFERSINISWGQMFGLFFGRQSYPYICDSFEPLFCVGSVVISRITLDPYFTLLVWTFIFYLVLWVALEIIKKEDHVAQPRIFLSLLIAIFVGLNFFSPHTVFFLIRQFLAFGILSIAIALILARRSALWCLFLAPCIHFGALPLSIALLFSTWKLEKVSLIRAAVLTGVVVAGFFGIATLYDEFAVVNEILSSLKVKIGIYASGYSSNYANMLRFSEELKLLIYWALLVAIVGRFHLRLAIALVFIYGFYLLTMLNPALHFRYHQGLLALAWMWAPLLPLLFTRLSAYVLISALLLARYAKHLLGDF